MKEITIIGGGLAGLSLGIALRHRHISVTLHEAGTYPRHRVCGEFISGLRPETFAELGLTGLLNPAIPQRTIAWLKGDRQVFSGYLPNPAGAISRYRLDALLRTRFEALGGHLLTNSRLNPSNTESTVWCAGRIPAKSPWLGLKCHVRGLELQADLEMHLGRLGYVGLARVDEDLVNVCGLFHQNRSLTGPNLLLQYLTAGGLTALRTRLEAAALDQSSASAVAGFQLGWQPARPGQLALGDACGMIPPFTGNGMSMAFESAYSQRFCVVGPYTRRASPWRGSGLRWSP